MHLNYYDYFNSVINNYLPQALGVLKSAIQIQSIIICLKLFLYASMYIDHLT